jgi:hypothetical protein
MAKLPALQFYPADWRKDPGVQALNYFDRGVWFEILCFMHESEQRGRLLLAGRPLPDDALARLLGLDKQALKSTLSRLIEYGVASRDAEGVLVNRRMVRDEEIRQIRVEAGKKGGNPALLNQNPTTQVNQNSTPSSSSSSSPSKKETTNVVSRRGERIPDDFTVDPEMIEWAKENCTGVSYTAESEKFVNYYKAKTGKDATKLDWPATWRNWMLNARDRYGATRNGTNETREHPNAKAAREWAELKRQVEG